MCFDRQERLKLKATLQCLETKLSESNSLELFGGRFYFISAPDQSAYPLVCLPTFQPAVERLKSEALIARARTETKTAVASQRKAQG